MAVSSNISFEDSLGDFSFSLYNDIYKVDNLCMSPFSLSATLLLLTLGTNGQSKSQLLSVLFKHGYPTQDVEKHYKKLHNDLNKRTSDTEGMQLSIANQFFLGRQHVHRILYKFKVEAKYDFGCYVGLMDFGQEPHTKNVINKWIEWKTKRKIKNFIPDGMLSDLTFMVLTNVIYFKGEWKDKFDTNRTRQRDFWMTKNNKTSTQMMYKKFKVKATENKSLDCKAIELPYNGGNISMVVVLPNEIDGLPSLEKKLSCTAFTNLIKNLKEQETEVILPRFKVAANFDLKLILSKLGVKDIFDPSKADFSKMVRPDDQFGELYVSNAMHESVIEVNEEGSEATAATAFVISFRSALAKAFQFTANHPFLFVIRDMNTGTILFLGRYSNPDMTQLQHYKVPETNETGLPHTQPIKTDDVSKSVTVDETNLSKNKVNNSKSEQKITSTNQTTTDNTPKDKIMETRSTKNVTTVIKEDTGSTDKLNNKSSVTTKDNDNNLTNTTSNKHDGNTPLTSLSENAAENTHTADLKAKGETSNIKKNPESQTNDKGDNNKHDSVWQPQLPFMPL